MNPDHIRLAQSELKKRGHDPGPVDGIFGSRTRNALNTIPGLTASWPDTRKLTGFIQLVAKEHGINSGKIDGLWGPQTEFAYNTLKHLLLFGELPDIWRPEERAEVNPNNWPSQRTDAELIAIYGEVGKHQKYLHVPYPHRLSWDINTPITRFQCHTKVHDSMLRVLTKVFDHYGLAEIQRLRLDIWGGCLNVRTMRGGTRFSMHSWGIAVDYDPVNNRLDWGRDRATFARPDYNRWWEFWEEEGWVSLGRTRNFDWMHVQAAKL